MVVEIPTKSDCSRLDMGVESGQIPLPIAPLVVLRARVRGLYQSLSQTMTPPPLCVQGFYPTYQALKHAGILVQEDGWQNINPKTIIVEIVRAKAETLALIADGFAALNTGGLLIIDGQKTDGIESILRLIKSEIPLAGVFSKSHGKSFWLYKDRDILHPQAADWQTQAAHRQDANGWWHGAGLFSADRIDAGSAFLAEHLPNNLGKRIGDFGGGTGWLSAQILAKCPNLQELHVFEAEAIALTLAHKNITDSRLKTHWCDITALPAAPNNRGLDSIVMNPPFHTSAKSEPALGQRFIETARAHLAPKGQLWLVANRHLPYESTLTRCFNQWREVAKNSNFKIICAQGVKTQKVKPRLKNGR